MISGYTTDTSRCILLYIYFLLVPFVLLVVPLLPSVFMFETEFIGLNNLRIGDSQGVTKIQVSFAVFSYKITDFSRI